jgi:hypothetical protein
MKLEAHQRAQLSSIEKLCYKAQRGEIKLQNLIDAAARFDGTHTDITETMQTFLMGEIPKPPFDFECAALANCLPVLQSSQKLCLFCRVAPHVQPTPSPYLEN